MATVVILTALVGFAAGLAAGHIVAPAPRGEFRRYGARDILLGEAEAARIRARL